MVISIYNCSWNSWLRLEYAKGTDNNWQYYILAINNIRILILYMILAV